jgi:hypothetical protein
VTPIKRLQAAIAKLEQLKAASTPGPWSVNLHHNSMHSAEFRAPAPWNGFMLVAVHGNDADPALIVTLHRTIDAQLRVLAYGATVVGDIPEAVMELADAILGGES